MRVATGTVYGDGYRLTAGRRFFLVVMASVMTMAVMLTAPATVWAADAWSREVRMQDQPGPLLIFEYWSVTDGSCTLAGTWTSSGSVCKSLASATDSVSAWIGQDIGEPSVTGSVEPIIDGHTYRIVATCYRIAPSGAGNVHIRWGNAAGGQTGDIEVGAPNACPNSGSGTVDVEVVADAGSVNNIMKMHVRGDFAMYISYFRVEDLDTLTGGTVDCEGFEGAGGDDGLVFPGALAEGLTSTGVEAWGHEPITAAAHTGYGACRFTDNVTYRYTPPEGVTAGETHQVAVEVSTDFPWVNCRVHARWGGSSFTTIVLWEFAGENDGGALGPGAFRRSTNAPDGATFLSLFIADGCNLHGVYLANVEGDPVLDNGADGTNGLGPDPLGNPWASCVPGSDFLAVGEWVAYAACLIAGIPGAIIQGITSLLLSLFMPSNLGRDWQGFLDTAGSRVPFGWFAQVSATISTSLAAPGSGIGTYNLTVAGATVAIGPYLQLGLDAVVPYRGLIFAGVALMMLMSCLRWIMAAVGVSPGGGSAGAESSA